MNIETQITPNPETLKFIVGKEYIFQDSIEITSEKEAEVFNFSKDFLSMTKLFLIHSSSSSLSFLPSNSPVL